MKLVRNKAKELCKTHNVLRLFYALLAAILGRGDARQLPKSVAKIVAAGKTAALGNLPNRQVGMLKQQLCLP